MRAFLSLGAALMLVPASAMAADAVQHVTLSARFDSRTSLDVSTSTLVFTVPEDGGMATTTIEYAAAARTRRDAEVVLTVERVNGIEGPGGAADAETHLVLASDVTPAVPVESSSAAAARWTGSGLRHGRLTFTLRAAAAGTYVVPLRLVLSAP